MRILLGLPMLLAGCGEVADERANVLLILSDDVGVDVTGTWDLHPDAVPTPALDALAADGVRFTRAYAMPSCSPTRAAVLTGRHGSAFGIGGPLEVDDPDEVFLPRDAVTIPEVLRQAFGTRWTSALVGKWHLDTFASGARTAALEQGFTHHVGTVGNLQVNASFDGEPLTYYDWERLDDGRVTREDTYVTTASVDDAIHLARTLPEPWFLVVALHAAHVPWNAPPPHLVDDGTPGDGTRATSFRAVVQAMDAEIGRLVRELAPMRGRTSIVYASDNGTPPAGLADDLSALPTKGHATELGSRVPLIVTGPRVVSPGRDVEHLVHLVDLFPTVLDLAGVRPDVRPPDGAGVSLLPYLDSASALAQRELVFVEQFEPNGPGPYDEAWSRMVRDVRWKLLRSDAGDQLFDLGDALLEGDDLLAGDTPLPDEAADAYARLGSALDAMP